MVSGACVLNAEGERGEVVSAVSVISTCAILATAPSTCGWVCTEEKEEEAEEDEEGEVEEEEDRECFADIALGFSGAGLLLNRSIVICEEYWSEMRARHTT